MCFYTKQTKTAVELENRFKATAVEAELIVPTVKLVGFTHPVTPIITNETPDIIECAKWGLLPANADLNFSKNWNTLNAASETLTERRTYKNYINNRCLVIVDGFYEYQHINAGRKQTRQYRLELEGQISFCLAGIWSNWIHPVTRQIQRTYSILTMKAEGIMKEVHNSKERMPVMLSPEFEKDWLQDRLPTENCLLDIQQLQAVPMFDKQNEIAF